MLPSDARGCAPGCEASSCCSVIVVGLPKPCSAVSVGGAVCAEATEGRNAHASASTANGSDLTARI